MGIPRQLSVARGREGKMKGRAAARFTFHPDPATVPLNGQAAESQPDAQTARFAVAAQTGEFIEDALLLGSRYPGTIVLDPHVNEVAIFKSANLDAAAGRAELAGIFHQVDQHTAGHVLIDPDRRQMFWKIGR